MIPIEIYYSIAGVFFTLTIPIFLTIFSKIFNLGLFNDSSERFYEYLNKVQSELRKIYAIYIILGLLASLGIIFLPVRNSIGCSSFTKEMGAWSLFFYLIIVISMAVYLFSLDNLKTRKQMKEVLNNFGNLKIILKKGFDIKDFIIAYQQSPKARSEIYTSSAHFYNILLQHYSKRFQEGKRDQELVDFLSGLENEEKLAQIFNYRIDDLINPLLRIFNGSRKVILAGNKRRNEYIFEINNGVYRVISKALFEEELNSTSINYFIDWQLRIRDLDENNKSDQLIISMARIFFDWIGNVIHDKEKSQKIGGVLEGLMPYADTKAFTYLVGASITRYMITNLIDEELDFGINWNTAFFSGSHEGDINHDEFLKRSQETKRAYIQDTIRTLYKLKKHVPLLKNLPNSAWINHDLKTLEELKSNQGNSKKANEIHQVINIWNMVKEIMFLKNK